MPDNVTEYFNSSARAFDSLYDLENMNFVWRYINSRFRHDIHDRLLLTMKHIEEYNLKTILDVGCGSGRYEVAISKLDIKKIVALDGSLNMIKVAKEKMGKIRLSDNKIISLDCVNFMDFQTKEKFDLVVSMGVFDYISDPLPYLIKMKDLALHSIIASFPSFSFYRSPFRKFRYLIKKCPVYSYTSRDIDYFSRQLQSNRIKIIKLKGSSGDFIVTFFLK